MASVDSMGIALRGPGRQPIEAVLDAVTRWLDLDEPVGTIRGTGNTERAAFLATGKRGKRPNTSEFENEWQTNKILGRSQNG
jgi:hypothetical protein